jgi:NitT/TauT family transport system substrate-binding protein
VIDRRAFCAGVAGALASAPRLGAAQANAGLKIGVFAAEVAAQPYYGVAGGFFKKAGLDVTLETFTSGAAIAPGLISGALDIGVLDWTSVIRAHARGLPFVYLTPGILTSTATPGFAVVVPADSPIHEAPDLSNRTIATNGIGNIGQLATDVWIDRNGGDWQSVKWLEVPLATTLDGLRQKRFDASPLAEPWLGVAREQGFRLIFPSKNPIAPYLGNGWIATGDWVHRNADAARRFVAAMRETSRWANAHGAAAAPLLAKFTNQDVTTIVKSQRYFFADTFTPAYVQALIDAAARYKFINDAFPASELFAGLG